MGDHFRPQYKTDTLLTMKLAIFALFAAGALAQKAPLNKQQINAAQKNAIKQANIAQAQAIKAGININVQKTINSLQAQNQDKVAGIVAKYQAQAQQKQGQLQQQYANEINQAKKASFKSVQNQLN